MPKLRSSAAGPGLNEKFSAGILAISSVKFCFTPAYPRCKLAARVICWPAGACATAGPATLKKPAIIKRRFMRCSSDGKRTRLYHGCGLSLTPPTSNMTLDEFRATLDDAQPPEVAPVLRALWYAAN